MLCAAGQALDLLLGLGDVFLQSAAWP
ncbi:MAG: hypothetical protein RLZZ255_1856, partial [Cyanobacteriota bacterium]